MCMYVHNAEVLNSQSMSYLHTIYYMPGQETLLHFLKRAILSTFLSGIAAVGWILKPSNAVDQVNEAARTLAPSGAQERIVGLSRIRGPIPLSDPGFPPQASRACGHLARLTSSKSNNRTSRLALERQKPRPAPLYCLVSRCS